MLKGLTGLQLATAEPPLKTVKTVFYNGFGKQLLVKAPCSFYRRAPLVVISNDEPVLLLHPPTYDFIMPSMRLSSLPVFPQLVSVEPHEFVYYITHHGLNSPSVILSILNAGINNSVSRSSSKMESFVYFLLIFSIPCYSEDTKVFILNIFWAF